MKITWTISKRTVDELRPYHKNPRVITEESIKDLEKSIDKFGLAEPIVIQPDGLIIGGHARWLVLKKKGETHVDCYVPDRILSEKELDEINIRLNANIAGVFDWDKLANEWDMAELRDWGLDVAKSFEEPPPCEDEQCPTCGKKMKKKVQ